MAARLCALVAAVNTYHVNAYYAPMALFPARRASTPRMATLAQDDIRSALADDKYAMDISSITEGSEKET